MKEFCYSDFTYQLQSGTIAPARYRRIILPCHSKTTVRIHRGSEGETAVNLYFIFVAMALMTIVSPGPGVLKSLTNALNYGLKPAFIGIAGLASGVFCVAAISATGIGVLLATSATAFQIIQWVGAAYVIYLGIKLFRTPVRTLSTETHHHKNGRTLFLEGCLLQFSNPNAVLFFLSILPQFIDHAHPYLPQFIGLVMTFCVLLILVHGCYAVFAQKAKHWFGSNRGGLWINRAGGLAFILLGCMLALAGKSS